MPAPWSPPPEIAAHALNRDITDAGLSTYGKMASIKAGESVSTRYARIFSSPIVRCVQTAYLMFLSGRSQVIEIEPSLMELLPFAEENRPSKTITEWYGRLNSVGTDLRRFVKINPDTRQCGDLVRFLTKILPRRLSDGEHGTGYAQQNIAVVTHSLLMLRDLLGGQRPIPGNNTAIRLVCEYAAVEGTPRLVALYDSNGRRWAFPKQYPMRLSLMHQCAERLRTPETTQTPPDALGYDVFCADVMCGAGPQPQARIPQNNGASSCCIL